MKMLITNKVLAKFKDTISENEYSTAWTKLQDYQSEQEHVKTYSETTFQSEFLSKIFDDILGYSSRTKSLKTANLLVEHKNPNSGEKVDGVIVDKNGEVKIVIELKSVKDTSSKSLLNKKRGGSDGKTPIQQAAIYLFQFPKSELAIVSNFDTIIIFDKKEQYRQEFSLFDMTYEQFQEFYLILNADSFWSGLTKLMISQTDTEEKIIDDEFFVKVRLLHKMLFNSMKAEYAEDLFGKFLALTILEDNGSLPTNLIKTIHGRKNDFDHQGKKSHWEVWSEFFKTMKSNTRSKEYLNISDKISELDIWQRSDYFGRIKLGKNVLDLVVELSNYDLWSIPMDKLFYRISKELHHRYSTIIVDDMFDLLKYVMTEYNYVAGEETTAFITLKSASIDYPLVRIYNQIVKTPVTVQEGNLFTLDYTALDRYTFILDITDLDSKDVVDKLKKQANKLTVVEYDADRYIMVDCDSHLDDNIEIINNTTDILIRNGIKDKIVILTEDDYKWLNEYKDGASPLSDYLEVGKVTNSEIRFNIDSKHITTFNKEYGEWEQDNYLFGDENYIYFIVKNPDVIYYLVSNQFNKLLMLMDYDKKTFLNLPISKELQSSEFLNKAKQLKDLRDKISTLSYKLDKLVKNNAPEIEIINLERILDNLYDQEIELSYE